MLKCLARWRRPTEPIGGRQQPTRRGKLNGHSVNRIRGRPQHGTDAPCKVVVLVHCAFVAPLEIWSHKGRIEAVQLAAPKSVFPVTSVSRG